MSSQSPPRPSQPPGLQSALASLRSGLLLESERAPEALHDLAATLPDLLGTLDPSLLDRVAERLGMAADGNALTEVLLLSEGSLHVVRPLRTRPGVALLARSEATGNVGLVLSQIAAAAAAREGPR